MTVYLITQPIGRWIWLHNQVQKMGRFLKFPYLYPMKIQFTDNGEIVDLRDYHPSNHNNNFKVWYSHFIVGYMRKSAVHLDVDYNDEYMLGYAQRAVMMSNQDIRATNEIEFVEDLIKFGHIKLLET